jgi:hypothetical protein
MYTDHDRDGYVDGVSSGDPSADAPEKPAYEDGPAPVEAGTADADALLDELNEATSNVVWTAEEVAARVREEAESTLAAARERATEIEDETGEEIYVPLDELHVAGRREGGAEGVVPVHQRLERGAAPSFACCG